LAKFWQQRAEKPALPKIFCCTLARQNPYLIETLKKNFVLA